MNNAREERKLRRGRSVVIGLLTLALALVLAAAPLTAWTDSLTGGQETAAQEAGSAAGADADVQPEAAADSLVEVAGEVEPLEDTVQTVAAPAGSGLTPYAYSDYNAGDVAVINDLIVNNGLPWDYDEPDNWPTADGGNGYIEWVGTPGDLRVKVLYLVVRSNVGLGLTGAVDFTGLSALEELHCFRNGLTSLDVSGCTALKYLDCTRNFNNSGSTLTDLDVSGCTALERLYCSDNSVLTSLDVSTCTALEYLNHTGLYMDLDLSQNPMLKDLFCSPSSILDVTNNPLLESLYVDARNINQLDVSQNPALKSLALNRFSSYGGGGLDLSSHLMLEELNLTSCDFLYLTDFYDILATVSSPLKILTISSLSIGMSSFDTLDLSGFPALEMLICTNNPYLTDVNISNNPALVTLHCYSNQLNDLDVSNNPALVTLNCYGNQLNDLDVSNNLALEILYCYSNNLTQLDCSGLAQLSALRCEGNPMTILSLSGCASLTNDVASFSVGYIPLATLEHLDISGCTGLAGSLSFNNSGLITLDASGCTALTGLHCDNNQLTDLDVSSCTALVSLHCDNNQLTDLDVSSCTALISLYCYSNQLITLDASGLTQLLNLDCYSNQLTALDVTNCTILWQLNCYNNQLITLDASGLTQLTSLDCTGNPMTTLDLSGCTSLTHTYIHEDYIPAATLEHLDLSGCSSLVYLNLTAYVDGFGSLITLNVNNCVNLQSLYCFDNQLTALYAAGCTSLNLLECQNNQLTTLDLTGNTALYYVYCSDNQLTSLDISGSSALSFLQCSYNQLTTLDLTGNTALSYVNVGSNQLVSLDCSGLTNLTQLYCMNNPLETLNIAGGTSISTLQLVTAGYSPVPLKSFTMADGYTLTISSDSPGGAVWLTDYAHSTGEMKFEAVPDDATFDFKEWILSAPPVNFITGTAKDDVIRITMPGGDDASIHASYASGFDVTVEYYAVDGTHLGSAGGSPYPVDDGDSFTVPKEAIAGYAPVYYTVDGGSTRYEFDTDPSQIILADTAIQVYYAPVLVEVRVPVQMLWAAFASDRGDIESPDYSVANQSDYFPVDVTLSEYAAVDQDGTALVSGTPASGTSQYNLNLEMVTGFSSASDVSLSVGVLNASLGRLDKAGGSNDTGAFTFTGEYAGSFSEQRQPRFTAAFKFELVLPS